MRLSFFVVIAIVTSAVWPASLAIDANSSTNDTVMKVSYTGSSPSTTDPTIVVIGKKIGTKSIANSTGGARGVIGAIGTAAGTSNGNAIGVLGVGPVGIWGDGNPAIHGEATDCYGCTALEANATGAYGYGVYANAESGSEGYGVFASATGGGANYGIYATASNGYDNWAGWFDGDIYVTGSVEPSDEMFKKNVQPLDGALAKVMALRPKQYSMKIDEFKDRIKLPSGQQYGLIAQEAGIVFPELVREATAPVHLSIQEREAKVKKTPLKFKSVNYTALIPILLSAIQEQQAEIEALKRQVANGK